MAAKVDLYNTSYGNYELDVYRQIRLETYGEDFGQTSWVTNEESHEIPRLLELNGKSFVLEIGSGSGRYALWVAETTGCKLVGLDINSHGIRNANQLAEAAGLNSLAHFEECDASKALPLADSSYDAVFSNDVLCHISGRPTVFREIFRILKPGGRFLFSDALVIGGIVSEEEIAIRSSIGSYFFTPPGENERLLNAAGFSILNVTETSAAAALISGRRRNARDKRKRELIEVEGQTTFDGQQKFLNCVHRLTSEKRLRRFLYLVRKEA